MVVISLERFVEVEFVIVVETENDRVGEVVEGATLLLRGASCAAGTVDETADAAHFQQFVLSRIGDVLVDFWHEFRPHTLLDALQHAERVGDRWFFHTDHFAYLQRTRGLGADGTDGDASVLAGIGGDAACLEDTRSPQPFVEPGCRGGVFLGIECQRRM